MPTKVETEGRVRLNTTPAKITQEKDAWILHFPRFGEEGTHFHSYGLLTPYFKGLTEGRLMATRCVNPKCPISKGQGELWLPPRADCPDCHRPMEWREIKKPEGYIYVKIEGVCTIVKSYLLDRKPIKIGDRVRAVFRTGKEATHTCLDLSFELI
jgi:uncharacterized OB-fold protein